MESLKKKTVRGVAWSTVDRLSVEGIKFLVMIIIARKLSPSDYGLVGMLAIFIAVSDSLINSGFSQALIRKQDRTEVDNSTVFYFNVVVSLLLYAVLYFVAPAVAEFYEEPLLKPVMRVMCLLIVIASFAIVQRALLTANIDFKTQTKASAIASLVSGAVGVYLAYHGYGVWTLVYQQLTNNGLNTLLLWLLSKWRPQLTFSWRSFQGLFSFGSKLMMVGLLDTIYNNLYQLVIGKFYSSSSLGFFTRARHFAEFPASNVTMILQRVTYPVLCTIQEDNDKLSTIYRRMLKLSAFAMFPILTGLAAVSYSLVDMLIGEKWHEAATLLIPICFSMMWYPVNSINLNLLQVKGRSDLFLKIEIVKKIMGLSILAATLPFGVLVMCYGIVLSTVLSLLINTYYTGIMINVGFIRQMRDIMPTFLVCVVMFAVVYYVQFLMGSSWLTLVVGILLGAVIFLSLTYIFRFSELEEVLIIIKSKNGK